MEAEKGRGLPLSKSKSMNAAKHPLSPMFHAMSKAIPTMTERCPATIGNQKRPVLSAYKPVRSATTRPTAELIVGRVLIRVIE